ncbi:hypothetical protein COMA2_40039 [Candidatus Nitrospira nitrificans]|uniref:Uncharacterized protein n=1 Tax=Candidatus Nitrospira nitrificans TaxID=1742973 RepID=A0A0S4LJP9_9BACT|nr:hypothetical protein COMA2_40039 [Candidatus Nitrospira nitrificans]
MMATGFDEQSVIQILGPRFKISDHLRDITRGKRMVVPRTELEDLPGEDGSTLADRAKVGGLSKLLEVWMLSLVQSGPFDPTVAIHILAEHKGVQGQHRPHRQHPFKRRRVVPRETRRPVRWSRKQVKPDIGIQQQGFSF